MQNKDPRATDKFWKCTPIHELHKNFQVSYIYDYIIKHCKQQAEGIQNHENTNVRDIGKGETLHRKCKRRKLGGGQAHHCSSF
jgi:hypothetical protein